MWELDCEESWVPKNWWFWSVVLEKTVEGPLDCKESKLVNPKINQPWIFLRRTDAEAEAPILWPPDVKNWLTGKDPDAGKDWRQKKGVAEDEMVGYYHWFSGHEFEQIWEIVEDKEARHGVTQLDMSSDISISSSQLQTKSNSLSQSSSSSSPIFQPLFGLTLNELTYFKNTPTES